jgi:chemotaxis methyl-accepting protein methylase/signal transduction histidine kinase
MKSRTKLRPGRTVSSRTTPPRRPASSRECPIVGIGASAGGLEAFTKLLKQLPTDTGYGFVLVQHLDPQHESALTLLLSRVTTMRVREAVHNLRVEANNVYIIPPNKILGVVRGVLKLQPRSRSNTAPRSIDHFFETLARDQRDRAIGVILSGNATDGTMGLESIKAEGGLTFAQDESARYSSMPQSAVAAGCVDRVLSPTQIARELARIARHPFMKRRAPGSGAAFEEDNVSSNPAAGAVRAQAARAKAKARDGRLAQANGLDDGNTVSPRDQEGYQEILMLLRSHSGVDFSHYKPSTIRRRIARRTVLSQRNSLSSYAGLLRGNTRELDALYADALINVTSFFRNPDAFEVLKRKVFSKLLQRGGGEPVRVWVLGCSTGQEAYSIAMAFLESAEKFPHARKLQVFATDLNEANLEKGRHGFYGKSLVQDVSAERLRTFFVEEEGGYRVIKKLRDMVVFARQNVIADPPFSHLDLISCRNVMIYLEPSLQNKIVPTFHYALKPEGSLFLGASESIGGFGELFAAVDRKQKIFAKKAAPTRAFHLPVKGEKGSPVRLSGLSALKGRDRGGISDAFRSELNAEREADRLTLNQFAPPGVLINADMRILQFRGQTSAYLEQPTGKATFDLLRMARDGLVLPLRAALASAARDNKSVRAENVPVTRNSGARTVNIEVIPLKNLKERCFLVLFEGSNASRSLPSAAQGPSEAEFKREESGRFAALERDLTEARDYLQSVQENQESANEELQASNEEGQSANEELQSLNEELETSKEELESTNEELTTVNEEMASQNAELHRLIAGRRKDEEALRVSDTRFRALFDIGPIGVYTCDRKGIIQEFNRCSAELWGRKPKVGDPGEKFCGSFRLHTPTGAFMPHGQCPMAKVLSGKIASARDVEVIIERPDGTRITVVVNIVPLKNDDGSIAGAINCFYNITARKHAEDALQDAQHQLSQYAKKLESMVTERTAKLVESNNRLKASDTSNRLGKEEYRALLSESHVMQGRLRHVTHQVINAQEEERKEISRELHDGVVQTLIGINVELTALANEVGMGGDLLKKRIAPTQRLVVDAVNAVHRFARGLRPAVLDDLGLIPAIQAHCSAVAARNKLKIKITAFRGIERLGGIGRTVLFRVAQEALTNVVRHAHASRVHVNIVELPGAIRMDITDNGKSFHVEKFLGARNPKRIGLIGMKERIAMIGGKLTIQSSRGGGTTVRADVPFSLEKERK